MDYDKLDFIRYAYLSDITCQNKDGEQTTAQMKGYRICNHQEKGRQIETRTIP